MTTATLPADHPSTAEAEPERMRISVASLGEERTRRFADQARLCELLGYDGIFHADEKWTRDVYVRQGFAAAVTERITLGMSVTDPFTRHPGLTAQATATLADAAEGRLIVTIAAGSHFETLPDITPRHQVTAIREAMQVMRGMWRGERVTLDGKVIRIEGGKLDFEPEYIPTLWVAGRGPKVLRMAGEAADGVLMGSFATRPGIEYAREQIATGLERAGRSWDDITLASWLYVSILDDEDEEIPEDALRGMSHAFWSSRAFFQERIDDFADDLTDEFRTFINEAPHEWSPEVMGRLRSLIPRGLFDSLAVVGTEEQVRARVAALRDLGVQHCVFWPFPRSHEAVEDVIVRLGRTLLPSIAETRSLADYQRVD